MYSDFQKYSEYSVLYSWKNIPLILQALEYNISNVTQV